MDERQSYPGEGGETADWLEGWRVEPAEPGFRERLRGAFVSGEARASSEGGQDEGAAVLEAQLAPYLDALDAPPAAPEFAADLRAEFVREAPVACVGRGEGAPVPRPVPHPARRLSLRWRLLAGGLAAAAAAWLLFLRPTPPDAAPAPGDTPVASVPSAGAPALVLVPGSFSSPAELAVDGSALTGLGPAEIDARLATAETVATGDSAARLRFGDHFVLELGPHSRVAWLRAEGLSDGDASGDASGDARDFRLRTEEGAMRVATGPDFPGSRMIVEAPFLDVEVVGTVFGIDVYDGATCLCCCEGAVEVHPRVPGRDVHRVVGGSTSLQGPEIAQLEAIPDGHRQPLERLARFWE